MFLSEMGTGVRLNVVCCYDTTKRGICNDSSISVQPTLKNENNPPGQTVHSKDLLLKSKNSCKILHGIIR